MKKIEVIGLGAGDIEQLPLGIYRRLINAKKTIFVRTTDHPVITQLQQEEGVEFISFDAYYEKEDQFSVVYERIVADLLKKAEHASIIYAVPGHPMLAEKTVELLLAQAPDEVQIIGGQSYLDALFTTLKIDPIDGFQFVDGTNFERNELNYRQHLIFCQVYDRFIASEIKLKLLEDLPPEHEVQIIEAAGSKEEKVQKLPLSELDHSLQISNLTTVYIPPVHKSKLNHTFNRLREIIAQLRGPDGCPWDKEQTHESLREYAIEEVYEFIDAVNEQDDVGIIEELGDLLLQIMLHSQIGEDNGYFTIDDVIHSIVTKMIHRHPHVFADKTVTSVEAVYKNWDELKQEEKKQTRKSILDGVSNSLPALPKAYQLQKKAAKVGFDWDHIKEMWEKLEEELQEVCVAIQANNVQEIEKELGDVFFVLANISRYYKINPEVALNQTNQKFIARFKYIEEQLRINNKQFTDVSLAEMDEYWDQAKGKE